MALEFAKGTISWAAAEGTGSKSVTGLSFQPDAVIFFSALTNTTGAYVSDQDVMVGAATSSSQEWVAHFSSQAKTVSTLSARGKSATACIRGQINGATTIDFEADFTSMNSDGFTVNLSNSPSVAVVIHYLAIGGSDITNAKAGTFTIPTSGTPFSVTDPGFQPDMCLFVHTFADGTNGKLTLGAATGSSNDFTSHISDNSGAANVQAARTQRAGILTSSLTNSVSINFDTSLNAFTASGFDVDVADFPAAAETAYYLAIEGGQWAVNLETEPASAGAKDTSLSFTPTGLFLFGGGAVNDTAFSAARDPLFTIGASDGTNEGTIWTGNDDGNTDSPAAKRHDTGRAFWHANTATTVADPPGVTTTNEADASFAASKFTLTWTSAGASKEFIYVAGGSAVSGTTNEETGAAPADTVLSGTDVFEATEVGAGTADTIASGADVFEATETAAGVADTVASAADVFEATELGSSPAGSVASGVAEKSAGGTEYPTTGAGVAGTISAAADVFEATETAAAFAAALAAGVSQYVPPGPQTYEKAGTLSATTATAAADAFEAVETSTAAAGSALSGADTFTATETGAIVTSTLLAGFAEGQIVYVTDFFDQPTLGRTTGPPSLFGAFFDLPTPRQT